jgi:hypothetical protein
VRWELDVDNGTGDGDDAPVGKIGSVGRGRFGGCGGHAPFAFVSFSFRRCWVIIGEGVAT